MEGKYTTNPSDTPCLAAPPAQAGTTLFLIWHKHLVIWSYFSKGTRFQKATKQLHRLICWSYEAGVQYRYNSKAPKIDEPQLLPIFVLFLTAFFQSPG